MIPFEAFSLDPTILEALQELGYKEPTPIQQSVIPLILQGKDILGLAETGSGKTAACAIPLCHLADPSSVHIQGLVIVPTRELALQYAQEAQKIGKFKGVKVFALYGGEDMALQRAKLKHGVQFLVATPGRLIDFVYQRAIDLSHVKALTLDEADEMLSLGFLEDLEFIMGCLVQKHQTLLFSATMPKEIKLIAQKYMNQPENISLISDQVSPDSLSHEFFFSQSLHNKKRDLIEVLRQTKMGQTLIFVNSRFEAEKLYRELRPFFPSSDFLHGGLSQDIRTIVTNKFSKGKVAVLVATDVASRGLDFSGVTHVINLHFPEDKEIYLHRSGRTARRGREGTCISFVVARDFPRLKLLLKHLGKELKWISDPPHKF